jgi:hypothetical protein
MRLSWPLGPLIPEAGRSLAHGSPNGRAIRPFISLRRRSSLAPCAAGMSGTGRI